jgi:hypothetical protein
MIIIPETQTIVLQPPRTGTTSLRDALLKEYPQAFLIYRHMEADGIPFGYNHFRKVCQVRHPFERLKSMYFYMRNPNIKPRTCAKWVARVKAASNKSFEEWLHDPTCFVSSGIPGLDLRPRDCQKWIGPSQKKSQILWAKGADQLLRNEHLNEDAFLLLGVDVGHVNAAKDKKAVECTSHVMRFLHEFHSWDMEIYNE